MKTIISTLLTIVIVVLVISCNEDKNEKESPLIGEWIYKSFEEICPNPDDNNSGSISCTSTDCNTLVFKKDGTYQYIGLESGVEDIESGTYNVDGNIITFCEDDIDCDVIRTYEITGDNLMLTESFTCDFIETYEKQ